MNPSAAADRAIAVGLDWLECLSRDRYAANRLCSAPLASREDYVSRWQHAKAVAYPAVDAFERSCGASIDAAWFHDLALLTQVTQKRSATCYQHGRLLYAALSRYLRGPGRQHVNIVETGTARGFSALCMAKALADAGAAGKVMTFDVLPHDARMYWNCLRDADGPRTRAELLADYADLLERHVVCHRGDARVELRKLSFTRVHFAFLDSAHTHAQVIGEFAAIGAYQRAGDLLLFDDYSPAYPGVVAAADEISRVHGYRATVIAASAERAYLIAEKQCMAGQSPRIGVFSFGRTSSQRCPNKLLRPFGDTTLTDLVLDKLSAFGDDAFFAAHEQEFEPKCERHHVRLVRRTAHSASIDEPITDILSFLRDEEFTHFLIVNACLPFLRTATIAEFLRECVGGELQPAFAVVRRTNHFIGADRRPLNFPADMRTINTKTVEPVLEFGHALYFFSKDYFFANGRYWDWRTVRLLELGDRTEMVDIDTEEDFAFAEALWHGSRRLRAR